MTAGTRVLITGAGPIGLVAVQTARAFGATEVVVSDVNPSRLALARELGATEVVDAREHSVRDLPRPPQVLLECSGFPPATSDGIRARWTEPAGAVLSAWAMTRCPCRSRSCRRVSSRSPAPSATPTPGRRRSLATSGQVDLDRLVTGTYGLAQAADALTASRRDAAAVKAVVRPWE